MAGRRAASQILQRKWDDYPPAVQEELRSLEQQLGGRRSLVGLLLLAPMTTDTRYVIGLLADPINDGVSLAAVCAQGNIIPGDLLKLLGAAALHKGQVLARQRIGQHLAGVVQDVMLKAQPYLAACSQCLGTGSLPPAEPTPAEPNPSPTPCDVCHGSGQLLYQPTFERQKLAIELGLLLPKAGGLTIAQTNVTLPPASGGGTGGTLEQLQEATDRILYGDGADVVDGEAIPVETPQPPDPPEAA